MTWNPALPAYTSKLALSPGYIQSNWNAIDNGTTGTGTGFTRNHVTMSDSTNGGLHFRCDFYQAVVSPALTGVASCYPRTVTNTELFYKNAVQDMQVTNSLLTASSGQGMFPGGLQIRAGTGTATSAGNPNSFNLAFPSTCISVVAQQKTSSANPVFITTVSNTSFTALKSGSNADFYYVAIGY
jgi:hypothetical protein